jgi:hypothetical protein
MRKADLKNTKWRESADSKANSKTQKRIDRLFPEPGKPQKTAEKP